jgi:ABC-type antimicrobial peptide transport system permease subunit
MQALLEAFRAALASLLANRMRSVLTTLGIVIGTGSVIAVVSLVQGFSASIKNQLADLGGEAGDLVLLEPVLPEAFRPLLADLVGEPVEARRRRGWGVLLDLPGVAISLGDLHLSPPVSHRSPSRRGCSAPAPAPPHRRRPPRR